MQKLAFGFVLVGAMLGVLAPSSSAAPLRMLIRAEIWDVDDRGSIDDALHQVFAPGQELWGWFVFDPDAAVTDTFIGGRNADNAYGGAISEYAIFHQAGSGVFDNGGIRVIDDQIYPPSLPEEEPLLVDT